MKLNQEVAQVLACVRRGELDGFRAALVLGVGPRQFAELAAEHGIAQWAEEPDEDLADCVACENGACEDGWVYVIDCKRVRAVSECEGDCPGCSEVVRCGTCHGGRKFAP